MRGSLIELTRIRIGKADHVAGEFNTCGLHSETYPEVRDFIFARIANRDEHPFDAALAKAAGNENSVVIFELRLVAFVAGFQSFGFNLIQLKF
jgi:hypothetical protein